VTVPALGDGHLPLLLLGAAKDLVELHEDALRAHFRAERHLGGGRRLGHLKIDPLPLELAVLEHLAEHGLGPLLRLCAGQNIEQPLLHLLLDPLLLLLPRLHCEVVHGDVDEVPNDHVHVAAVETHLRELGGLHLDEGRLRQLRQPSRDLSLAHTSRTWS
jgi:hypothetical protein